MARQPSGAMALLLGTLVVSCAMVRANYASHAVGLKDAMLLREMVARMGNGLADPSSDYLPLNQGLETMGGALKSSVYERHQPSQAELDLEEMLDLSARGGLRDEQEADLEEMSVRRDLRDDLEEISVPRELRDNLEMSLAQQDVSSPYGVAELAMHPSLRDHEYMSHGHLLGNMFAQFPPGSSYGTMRIKPSGSGSPQATSQRKTDGVLPAYCNPPNPCPLGYTASDGCEEVFQNTAAYSRNYQSQQQCMCDTEHMFDCPDSNRESEIGALARSIQNEGVLDSTLDKIMSEMRRNPFLNGDKLPVAAKKGVLLP